MTIDGRIETARKITNKDGDEYYLITCKARRFLTFNLELGEAVAENVGLYGRFTYESITSKIPNTWRLVDWKKE